MKALLSLSLLCTLAACQTRHEIVFEQPKPMEININLSGRLELVITQARQDMEFITGEKSPPVTPPATAPGKPGAALSMTAPVLLAVDFGGPRAMTPEQAALLASLKARYPEIRQLHSAHLTGESHQGLMVARGQLTEAQQKLLAAENADRLKLYQLKAAEKKETVDEVGLAYFYARLGHARTGDWVETLDQGQWRWIAYHPKP